MDPDLVRQQEEAEREAMAALAKKASGAASLVTDNAGAAPTYAPVYFTQTAQHTAPHFAAAAPAHVMLQAAFLQRTEPALLRVARFMSFGLAGGMLGGGFGIASANWWEIPREQANLAIFGPAGALAVFCAVASLFAGQRADPAAS